MPAPRRFLFPLQTGRAFTIHPVGIFYRTASDRSDPCLHVHEMYHWRQQRRITFPVFLVAWLAIGIYLTISGIWNKPTGRAKSPWMRRHPMEREAYRLQDACAEDGDSR